MDVRPSVQKSLRTMAFSRVSTGDSDIPSSCEMKVEAAFKTLQEKPAFFWVRASRGPLHMRQKTKSRSHIPISEGRLLLRCLWKAGLPLQSKTGNHSHPQTICGSRKFPQDALMKLMILYTWDGFLRISRGPFHLRQKKQSLSHIPISEGRLLLRCFWKVGLPL